MPRALVVILDSLGVGAAPDAAGTPDEGANTFGHIAQWCVDHQRPLHIPNLLGLGLGHAMQIATEQWPAGLPIPTTVKGAYGAARPISKGKDTPSGHWELMGCPVPFDWGYFDPAKAANGNIFPKEHWQRWLDACGLAGSLANCHASGTEVINQWGDEQLHTGLPICYTSSDSIFQIAAHQEAFGLDRLYEICEVAKPIFDELNIARVIARPFLGQDGNYRRTANRRDYTTPPPAKTLLDALTAAGREVHAVGKIKDIFAARGISHHTKGDDNAALCALTLQAMQACPDGGMVFTNLVDFDMLYGHRRDPGGYAQALEEFDAFLPALLAQMQEGDLLAISADHGCDPTWPGSDHTREFVPVLLTSRALCANQPLGQRASFADLGQTLAHYLGVPALPAGTACQASTTAGKL